MGLRVCDGRLQRTETEISPNVRDFSFENAPASKASISDVTAATNPYLAKAISKNRGLMNSKLHKDIETKKGEDRRKKREDHEGLKKALKQGMGWAGGKTTLVESKPSQVARQVQRVYASTKQGTDLSTMLREAKPWEIFAMGRRGPPRITWVV